MAIEKVITGTNPDSHSSKNSFRLGLRPLIGASLALMAAGSFAVYWFWFILVHWFTTTGPQIYPTSEEAVLSNLSLGLLPIALWLSAFLVAVAFRRSLFRHYRAWLASVAFLSVVLGALSLNQVDSGFLSWFTMGGSVTLGGVVGDRIAGPAGIQAIARLTAIGVLGVVMLAPSYALAVSVLLGRLALYVYIVLVVGLKAVGRMYRSKEDTQGMSASGLNGDRASADSADVDDAQSQNHLRTLSASDLVPQGSGYTFVSPATGRDLGGSIVSTAPPTFEVEPENQEAHETYSPPARPSSNLDLDEFQVTDAPVSERDAALNDVDYEPTPNGNGASQNGQEASNGKFNRFWESSQAVVAPPEQEMPAPPSNGFNGNGDQEIMPYFGSGGSTWARPPMNVLQDLPDQGISREQIAATADSIKRTLSEYGIEVEIGQVSPGPTVTMYGLIPGWVRRYKQVKKTDELGRPVLDDTGRQVVTRVEQKTRVKVDSIISREKDLSLALKTPSIRIETPVMGQSQLGIEVPNAEASPVTLRSVMESDEFKKLKGKADLPVAFGKGSGGETVVIDLAKMPHLLIAGATGSGKSVCLNALISCLIMEKSPAELRLLLIDPKRVELTPYNGVPHLLTPVVVESEQVIGLLKGMIREMMDRYRRMEEVGVRNIDGFNKRYPENRMPFMVVVVDELADLMMTAAFEVEQALCRLAQLGRATGIHLVIATQRPSVDVVTGLIKANFPSRASFAVTSHIDSRTILDTTGAEKLLGRGDMLYMPIDASRPERIQGVFISDKEIEKLVGFWQSTPRASLPHMSLRALPEDDASSNDRLNGDSADELLDKAVELAQMHNKLSTSLLQRRMRIGYPRAARLMDELEERGIVGPSDGSKSRDVIINEV